MLSPVANARNSSEHPETQGSLSSACLLCVRCPLIDGVPTCKMYDYTPIPTPLMETLPTSPLPADSAKCGFVPAVVLGASE